MRPRFTLMFIAAMCAASSARAESWRVHGSGALAHAVSGHQSRELGYGVAALGALEYGLSPEFGVAIEAGWLYLAEGEPPEDVSLAPLEGASALSGALGLRWRPLGGVERTQSAGLAGLWLGGGAGMATTNGLNRLFLDAHVGYDFFLSEGRVGLGPTVGFLYINQPDDRLRPDDANVLLVGLHAVFDSAPPKSKTPHDRDGDRDGDGLLDPVDACPDEAEDKDGFEDTDGCPDEDNDKDGIVDQRDDCALEPEDKDGFEDGDGCPDEDNDKDGLADGRDECPDEAEDKDGFEDEDGCPDRDNDGDGLPDTSDLCPDEPETKNNYADHDGCPDEEQVRVVGDKIVLDDRVHFRTNSHIIRGVSYPLLTRLSKLVVEHPEYTHISIEGHADARGDERFNKQLSQRRAESVLEFMVEHGVARDRLSATGYGSERPLVDAKNEHAYLLNRRVEFVVTRKIKQVVGPGEEDPTLPAPPPGSSKLPEPANSEGSEDAEPPDEPAPEQGEEQ